MVKKCWNQWNQTKPKGEVNVGHCRVIFQNASHFECYVILFSSSVQLSWLHFFILCASILCQNDFWIMLHHHFVMRQGIDCVLHFSFCHSNGKTFTTNLSWWHIINRNIYSQTTTKERTIIFLWDLIGRYNFSRMEDRPNRTRSNI